MSQHIEAEWKTYVASVHPRGGTEDQLQVVRMAFYGGARALLLKILVLLSPGDETTDADLRMMKDLHQEILDFAARLKRGGHA